MLVNKAHDSMAWHAPGLCLRSSAGRFCHEQMHGERASVFTCVVMQHLCCKLPSVISCCATAQKYVAQGYGLAGQARTSVLNPRSPRSQAAASLSVRLRTVGEGNAAF